MKNCFRFFIVTMFALCISLFAVNTQAQTATTGSIEGTVADQNGAAVPGVTVTVSGPNLGRALSTTSEGDGRYRFLNVPPGKYTVTVDAAKGFAKSEQTGVEVSLSKTSNVSFALQAGGSTVSVDVSADSAAVIDTTNNTTGSNVSTDQFSNFPTQRTVQSLFNIAPTAARSGLRDASGRDRDPSIGGSSGPENNYILDGVQTTDPAFGGSGANLPFEFIQEVEIKTGAFGAEYGKSTGGVLNVITKSGRNEFFGSAWGFFSTKGMVRETKFFPFTGSAPNGFSEVDAGVEVGGPIVKEKLLFYGAFNPQRRKNFFLTQTFRLPVESEVTTPYYSGKITYLVNGNNTLNFSTFGDFTKQEGFLFGGSGFGTDSAAFRGRTETGGHNYTVRLNSTITPKWIAEIAFGLHLQRANIIPESSTDAPLILDAFAIRTAAGTIVAPTETTATTSTTVNGNVYDLGRVAYVYSPNGFLERNFLRGPGFGLFTNQDRNRWEINARFQNILGPHTLKYGFEYTDNIYRINTASTGPSTTFGTQGLLVTGTTDSNSVNGYRVTNSFVVCTTRTISGVLTAVCPSAAGTSRLQAAITAGQGPTGVTAVTTGTITAAEANTNPLLVRSATRVRDFQLFADTKSRVESFYVQDDWKVHKNITLNLGLRWDFQQSLGNNGADYLKLNNFKHNTQPRLGFIWDFTGKGKGKFFANYARFLETPIPLDVNVRAGSENSQTDKNFNASRINAPVGSIIVPGIRANPASGAAIGSVNLGAHPTPIDEGLRPQTVNEFTAGLEYEVANNFVIGTRGIYRATDNVIEDGSFDDGDNYFLFNPGDRRPGSTEDLACLGDATTGRAPQCFGYARRYYRALEFTATKRFSNNYQFIASYVFSSLIGNYEGLFRNDNGQSDPNITSLFDLTSLLANTYGRLPNDRPHQFKFNGSYQTPFKLMISGNFYAQSGIPFDQLVPHPVYGNNEGFGVPRGTAVNPITGDTRTPTTFQLDLGFYYPLQLTERTSLKFTADWFNVTNAQRAIRQDTTFQINSGVTGVPPVTNPFFGQGLIYQFPSALRLGVKFQF